MNDSERSERILVYLEEIAAVEDEKASEPDYDGPRGLGKYVRSLVAEIRRRFQ